jgi:replicative DNA helicase
MDEQNPFDGEGVPVDFKASRRTKQELADPARQDRQPPRSIEAEQGVLGCIFLSPSSCVGDCVEKFQDRSDVFYDLRHRAIYETVVELFDQNKAIDVITVQQVLRDRKQLDEIGGVAYLASLPDMVPSAANLGYYIDIVKEKHLLRRAIGICTDTISRAYEHNGEVAVFFEEFGHDANEIIQGALQSGAQTSARSVKQLLPKAVETIENVYLNKGKPTGLYTGLVNFDNMTCGLQAGEMIIVAARPSVGKSSLAMNIADHVGVNLRQPVGVFSLEMSADSLMLRMICSRARVNIRRAMTGYLENADFPKLTAAQAALSKAPIYIDDSRALSILQLKAKARQMAQAHGVKLVIIDYAQLMCSTNRRAQSRQEEVADVANGIQSLAGELNIPILTLCQLNREVERRGPNSKPRLSDLRETGTFEQCADVVAMLYRQQEAENYEIQNDVVPVNLLIAKQRNGPTGEIPLMFLREYTKFEVAAPFKSNDPTENFPKP